MNPVLEEMIATQQVWTPDGETIDLHSGISREQGEFLQELIAETKPVTTLEVGLAYGVSALFICDALVNTDGACHIAMDPGQFSEATWKGAGVHAVESAGYSHMFEFHNLPSHRVLPLLEAEGRSVDFAFIDGAHFFDQVMVDFFCVDRLLRVGGVVAFDDLWMPGIQRLCRYVLTNRSYSVYRYFPVNRSQLFLRRKMLNGLTRLVPGIRSCLKAEYNELEIDRKLGLPNQCIAFKKEANVSRPWEFHRDF